MSRALLERLKSETDPERASAQALDILRDRRERQYVDVALAKLKRCTLGDSARAVLRPKAFYYLDNPERDSGCTLRDALVRLLVDIGNPADLDVYLRGIDVHEQLLGVDVGQNLRAASLVGIGTIDPSLASACAVRLLADLDDTSRFSGEPAITAMQLLNEQGNTLPIYQYLLMLAHVPPPPFPAVRVAPEVESKALELLAPDFPETLYRALAQPYLTADRAIPQVGIVGYVVANRRADLRDLLEAILKSTRHDDLRRYTLIEIAASRQPPLIDLLYQFADVCPVKHVQAVIEAVSLTTDSRHDDAVARLERRL